MLALDYQNGNREYFVQHWAHDYLPQLFTDFIDKDVFITEM